MGGIGEFVSNIIMAPEKLGQSVIDVFTPKKPKQPRALKATKTTQFFDPDRGKKIAAARKRAGAAASGRTSFKIDRSSEDDAGQQTRGGLAIS